MRVLDHKNPGKKGCYCLNNRISSLEIVRLEAYNILSILRSQIHNTPTYSSTSNLVPILGSDTSSSRSSELNLIRKFRALTSNISTYSDNFLGLKHIQPFLEVLKAYDGKNANIVIVAIETISNLSKYDLLCFDPQNSQELINAVFDSILSVFSKIVEHKEDLLILKVLSCFEYLLLSELGTFINTDNITRMINFFIILITVRNRNSIVRKFFHQKIVEILLASLNNDKAECPEIPKENASSRRNTIYLFVALLISRMTNINPLSFSAEDSHLSHADKKVLANFRSTISPIIQNAVTYQNISNDFYDDICKIGLVTLTYSLEFNLVNLEDILGITPIIQTHFTHSIYRLLFSESIGMYSIVLRVLWNLFVNFRGSIKSQIEVFLTHLLGTITNFVSSSKCTIKQEIVEMNMEFILDICKHPKFLMEIYMNYDCDMRCSNIFDLLARTLIFCISSSNDDGLNNISYQQRGKKNPGKGANKKRFTAAPQHRSSSHNTEGTSWNYEVMGIFGIKRILKFLVSNELEDENENTQIFEQKHWKSRLSNAACVFNKADVEGDWVLSIKEFDFINDINNPKDVAAFIKYTPELDLKRVGEYLGTHKNPTFVKGVLKDFTELHCFSGLPVVMAIRMFLSSFRLPGESQQIERIIEMFAKIYFESQPVVSEVEEQSEANNSPRWVIQEKYYWDFLSLPQFLSDLNSFENVPYDMTNDAKQVLHSYFISRDSTRYITTKVFAQICESLKEGKNDSEADTISTGTNMETNHAKEIQKSNISEQKIGFASIENSDVIFVLAYSIIMLNTDLHNQQIKNKMKLEDFIRNNKGINGGKNLPFEFLEDIYLSIKNHEIKLHQNVELTGITYDQHFWADHVLERQKILGKYITDNSSNSFLIKEHLFQAFCQNNLVKFVNELFLNAKSIGELKQSIRLFWLIVRLCLKFKNYDLINTVFQLSSLDVTYSLTYRCQISIAFIFNVLAIASDFFDFESWSKTMNIVLRLYCLNLLPMSFAALDLDSRIYGLYEPLNDNLIAPSIRFKRNTDLKKNVGWLGGWTSFIPFNRTNSNTHETNNHALSADQYFDDEESEAEDHHSLLFLFDVQSATNDVIQNRFFDVYLLRNKFSPIHSSGDEDAINEVTKALENDIDKEELLPQVLAYMNMRLAFLNIYKLDDLFMGTVSLSSYSSFLHCLKVIIFGIFRPNAEHDYEASGNENTGIQEQLQISKLGSAKIDVTLINIGSILDPSQVVLNAFRDKIASTFNLGIFARMITFVLKGYKDTMPHDENVIKKQKLILVYTIKCFDALCKNFIVDTAIPHLPILDHILKTFDLNTDEYNFLEKNGTNDNLLSLEQSSKVLTSTDSVLYSHICTTLLRLILWFSENSGSIVDHTGDSLDSGKHLKYLDRENGIKHVSITEPSDVYRTICGWLLHLIIHFENKVLNRHFDALAKALYNLADNQDILFDTYLVNLIFCALQRIINPYLPFYNASDGATSHSRLQKRSNLSFSNGSIITFLLKRSKCLVSLDSFYIARTAAQTLLSMALFSKPTLGSKIEGSGKGSDWSENLIAIQLLIEFKSFTNDDNANIEYLWLLSLHCLSIIFSVGPIEISNESIRGLNKLLIQESYPITRCTEITQIIRIFDYILAPMLTSNFQYPLPGEQIILPLGEFVEYKSSKENFWHIENPFKSVQDESEVQNTIWMSDVIVKCLKDYGVDNPEELSDRKASATNLICHTILSKLNVLITGEINNCSEDVGKDAGSNLECLLRSSGDRCSEYCVKQFVVIIQYILNVIIPSNGEIHNGINRDTYLETLKNFVLVLLTTPELKLAPESCIDHFRNDIELKNCLGMLEGIVDLEGTTSGEYVLSALLAHTLSVSDSLKDLFLDIIKAVFPSKDCN